MSLTTLKQVIARLETLALSHKQIKFFFIGAADEFLDSPNVVYPACFCELKNGSISLTNRETTFNFTFFFFDLMDTAANSQANEYEVKSDMVSIAQDFIALVYDHSYTGWEVGEDYQLEIKDYQLNDLAAGVSVSIPIGIRFDANKCQVPLN